MIADILEGVANQTKGCRGVFLLGKDGFIIEKHSSSLDEAESLVVELLGVLKKLDQLLGGSNAETMENEVTIESGEYNYYIATVAEGYFLFMFTDKQEYKGKCRYLLNKATLALSKELA